jgi:cobalt/nickel transport protein
MQSVLPTVLFAVCAWLASLPARAHFPILIHDAGLGVTNGVVTVIVAAGHPFELEMEAAPRPERLWALDARGRVTNLTAALQPTLFRGDTNAGAWQIRFEPGRGDTVIALDNAPSVDRAQRSLYREYVKVCLHRRMQEGWSQRTGQALEIVPLTRPYGLRAGMVFSGRLLRGDTPVAEAEVYCERLNDRRPAATALPPEPLTTFVVRTDADGRFVVSLPDAGWWVLGAYVEDLGKVRHETEEYRLEGFAGLWLKVEPDPPAR